MCYFQNSMKSDKITIFINYKLKSAVKALFLIRGFIIFTYLFNNNMWKWNKLHSYLIIPISQI